MYDAASRRGVKAAEAAAVRRPVAEAVGWGGANTAGVYLRMLPRVIVAVIVGGTFATELHQGPKFIPHEIATGLRGGYQVVAADLNRDGKPDLIAVASNLPDLVWYENPNWTPHVIASG